MQCSSCGTITFAATMTCPNCEVALPAAGFLHAISRVEELIRNSRSAEVGPELMKAEAELKRTALTATARSIAEAWLLANRARLLFAKSQYRQAEELAQQALTLLDDNTELALLRATALITLANVANIHHEPVVARRYIDRAVIEARLANEPFVLGNVLNGLANINRVEGNYEAALPLYQEALSFAEQAGALGLAAVLCGNIANVYQERGDMRTSLSFNLKGVKLAEQTGDVLRTASATANLGVNYMSIGELDTAMTYLQKSARMVDERENVSQYVHTYSNLAEIAWLKGNYAEAYEIASRITSSDIDYYRAHVVCYAVQIHCAVAMGEMEKARQANEQMVAERQLRPIPSFNDYYYPVMTAQAALKLGEGDWQAARQDYAEALRRADEHGDVDTKAQVRLMYAEALLTHETGANQQVRQLLDEAITLFSRMGASQNVQRAKMLAASLPQ